jgi:hypothetical protein
LQRESALRLEVGGDWEWMVRDRRRYVVVCGEAARHGIRLPVSAALGNDLLGLGRTWIVWTAGLTAAALARWFLLRHPKEAGGVEARPLP